MKRIFLVEDDLSLVAGLSFALKKQGYETVVARTSREARKMWEKEDWDLIILDVSLPDGSGYDLCQEIRMTSKVPIIFLTAADEETDIIMGLDMGGDDYITKPFKLAVFLSRVNALLRRSDNFSQEEAQLCSRGVTLRLLRGEAYKEQEKVELTAGEYRLLRMLMENPDQVLSPQQILSRLWDCREDYVDGNTLTVYIRRLRKKIEDDPGKPDRIVTVRRMGYKWNTGRGEG
ncbi:MAG TPA: response regulator transcription factor [Candidatus Choladousia intestinavium]|uniref:Stage 0 sporulation protein A homolog n=1 Tax=Candidatus Choladousia intestinavium TaxID=2840727 RepID=A0A9D1D857_9FIRM|nr:response regulator transcription factor [Candidatus Choladousia intestinavium]